MEQYRVKAPVALVIFNRPDTTERVFAEIAKARPETLLVVADGPRSGRGGEAQRCAAARAIVERVDWDCRLLQNYSETNLGCRTRVSSGLNWVFESVPEAIVLEDDCLPHPSFFRFCDEMLERYRDDQRVMQVCGTNYFGGWQRSSESYYFSKYGPIWGWASWRRAWQYYDVDLKLWPEVKANNWHRDFSDSEEEALFRVALYDKLHSGELGTWDYQWTFAKMLNSGLSVTPNRNLISNIGFGADSTHTSVAGGHAEMARCEMPFPLAHPRFVLRDRESDARYFSTVTSPRDRLSYLKKVVKSFLPAAAQELGRRWAGRR